MPDPTPDLIQSAEADTARALDCIRRRDFRTAAVFLRVAVRTLVEAGVVDG